MSRKPGARTHIFQIPWESEGNSYAPEDQLTLHGALNRVGQSLYGEHWSGRELLARSTSQIAEAEANQQVVEEKLRKAKTKPSADPLSSPHRSSAGRNSETNPGFQAYRRALAAQRKLFESDRDEAQAYDRKRLAWQKLRQALGADRLCALVLSDDGDYYEVPSRIWRSKDADSVFQTGGAKVSPTGGTPGNLWVEGRVLIRKVDLRELVSELTNTETGDNDAGQDGAKAPSDQRQSGQDPETKSGYTTEFIDLLFAAIDHFEITDSNQPKAVVVSDWFQEQVVEREQISNKLAGCMATIVRRPDRRKGGVAPRR